MYRRRHLCLGGGGGRFRGAGVAGCSDEAQANQPAGAQQVSHHPTEPSRLTSSNFFASPANSIGSSRKTCLQKPSTIRLTASSSPDRKGVVEGKMVPVSVDLG